MKKIMVISSSVLALSMLSGCANQPAPVVNVDQEPILVGIPITERVTKSSKSINEQLNLLEKINSNKYIGTYEMVEHNNGLDARKGSSRTIPESYNNKKEEVSEIKNNENKEVKDVKEDKLSKIVKKVEWNNNSANELGKLFANALDYKFVVNGNNDIDVTLKIENETLASAIEKFKKALGKQATIVVVEKNQTFNIIYTK